MLYRAFLKRLDTRNDGGNELVESQRIPLPIHVHDQNHLGTSLACLIWKTPQFPLRLNRVIKDFNSLLKHGSIQNSRLNLATLP